MGLGIFSFKPFRRIPSTDRDMNLLQSHIADALRSMTDTPRFLQGLLIGTVPTLVSHGLGRAYVSYWLGNYDTSITVKPIATVDGKPVDRTKFLVLQASAPVTLDLQVF